MLRCESMGSGFFSMREDPRCFRRIARGSLTAPRLALLRCRPRRVHSAIVAGGGGGPRVGGPPTPPDDSDQEETSSPRLRRFLRHVRRLSAGSSAPDVPLEPEEKGEEEEEEEEEETPPPPPFPRDTSKITGIVSNVVPAVVRRAVDEAVPAELRPPGAAQFSPPKGARKEGRLQIPPGTNIAGAMVAVSFPSETQGMLCLCLCRVLPSKQGIRYRPAAVPPRKHLLTSHVVRYSSLKVLPLLLLRYESPSLDGLVSPYFYTTTIRQPLPSLAANPCSFLLRHRGECHRFSGVGPAPLLNVLGSCGEGVCTIEVPDPTRSSPLSRHSFTFG